MAEVKEYEKPTDERQKLLAQLGEFTILITKRTNELNQLRQRANEIANEIEGVKTIAY